jgi:type 1 glutamine amidotransferase
MFADGFSGEESDVRATANKTALIVWGGWDGHEPEKVATVLATMLRESDFSVEMSDTLASFDDAGALGRQDLIVPMWTMGKITDAQCKNVCDAVAAGTGLAGCHGGMCDAFREHTDWQFMTGGQWVAHPGNEFKYEVTPTAIGHAITHGINRFTVDTEQYYMHVDPAVQVLATTRFPTVDGPHAANGPVDMPVIWTKRWGMGRVYYNALGHKASVVEAEPVRTLMQRGFSWAAR